MGRPTTYDPKFCDVVRELGKEGASKHEMAWKIGCAWSTFQLWQEVHPDFSAAVNEALADSQGWWEHVGRTGTIGVIKHFNPTSYIFQMKNRFRKDWNDRTQQQQVNEEGETVSALPVNITITPVEAKREN